VRQPRSHAHVGTSSPELIDIHRIVAGDGLLNATVCFNATQGSVISMQVSGLQMATGWHGNTTLHSGAEECLAASAGCCTATLLGLGSMRLANYEESTLRARVGFADGSQSEWVQYMSKIIPAPFATPSLVRKLYHVPEHVVGGKAANNSVAVLEFDAQYYSPGDMAAFAELYNVPILPKGITVMGPNIAAHCDNATTSSAECGESTLDIQWVLAVAPRVHTIFWSVPKGFLLSWFAEVANMTSVPLVVSISYGEPELDLGASALRRLEAEFMKLASRGVTVISTSGDLGASDGESCVSRLSADYPSTSRWTTSLGASQLIRTSMGGADVDNAACSVPAGSGFTTGGMFSAVFQRPWWQHQMVEHYLMTAQDLPGPSAFNHSGRAYNDVATLGSNIPIVLARDVHITGGTSASGPIFAALVALWNDELMSQGHPPLGFLNPLLYRAALRAPRSFRGLLQGNNRCTEPGYNGTNGNGTCCEMGFAAGLRTARWNPLGGLGAPIWDRLFDFMQHGPHPPPRNGTRL